MRAWLADFVIAHRLCPFADSEFSANRIRLDVTHATRPEELLQRLADELALLADDPAIATTLLIHPSVLEDFGDYNDFLDTAEHLLETLGYEGVFQIASFHPQYQFADTEPDDAENFTNRSPYPLLHLLREADVTRAVGAHPDIHGIPERNIACLRAIGTTRLQRQLDAWASGEPTQ